MRPAKSVMNTAASSGVRLPTSQAGTSLESRSIATQVQASPAPTDIGRLARTTALLRGDVGPNLVCLQALAGQPTEGRVLVVRGGLPELATRSRTTVHFAVRAIRHVARMLLPSAEGLNY